MDQLIIDWQSKPNNWQASTQELAAIISEAEMSTDAPAWMWSHLADVLIKHGGFKAEKDARHEVRRCRVISELGKFPYTVQEFIPLFLKSRKIEMSFNGSFSCGSEREDNNYIENEMLLWCQQIGSVPLFSAKMIEAAFTNWQVDEKKRLLKLVFSNIAYDAEANGAHLTAFATFLTASNDPKHIRATEVALANFIYRTKNHMRGVWKHSVHLMPILYGSQGSGKTTAIEHFLKPLGDCTVQGNFNALSDNSREFEMSVAPVFFFEEMDGADKADVAKLKAIMTQPERTFRQIYGKAATRKVVSTFIACTNKDTAGLIKDETGNRRFIQIETPPLDLAIIPSFDMLAMWRSVDENGLPPLYALKADLEAVTEVQQESRHKSAVQVWVEECDNLPLRATAATELFDQCYIPWLERMYPGQVRFNDLGSFRREMERLRKGELSEAIRRTTPQNIVSYSFARTAITTAADRVAHLKQVAS